MSFEVIAVASIVVLASNVAVGWTPGQLTCVDPHDETKWGYAGGSDTLPCIPGGRDTEHNCQAILRKDGAQLTGRESKEFQIWELGGNWTQQRFKKFCE